jgi:hypothetical protein
MTVPTNMFEQADICVLLSLYTEHGGFFRTFNVIKKKKKTNKAAYIIIYIYIYIYIYMFYLFAVGILARCGWSYPIADLG